MHLRHQHHLRVLEMQVSGLHLRSESESLEVRPSTEYFNKLLE